MTRIRKITAAWAVLFAIVHAYWSATADSTGDQVYIGFITVLGLVGAWVAVHGHVLLARLGGAALLAGVAVGTGRWLADWSLNGDGVEGVAITVYFLVGGLLYLVLARTGARPQALT
jgi:hypothetical protein